MKKFRLLTGTLAMTLAISTTAFAGQWKKDGTGWWYQNQDGSYLKSKWYWIDGASYLFNDDGYIYTDTTTPDGYQVDANGAWTIDGTVRRRQTQYHFDGLTIKIPNGYEVTKNDTDIIIEETDSNNGVIAMSVKDSGIAVIKGYYGEAGLKELSDKVAKGITGELGSISLQVSDTKSFSTGNWYHYLYNITQAGSTRPCHVYISFNGDTVRIFMILGQNREFDENRFMTDYVK